MRIVLDECLPKRLIHELAGHDVRTVQEMGWSGISNGKLLALAGEKFDAFITVDSNLAYQQNITSLPVAVIVLQAASNKIEDLRPLLSNLHSTLVELKNGQLYLVVA